MAVYFVGSGGSDSASGLTWAARWLTYAHAGAVMAAGDELKTTEPSATYCTLAQLKERLLSSRSYAATTLGFDASTKTISDSKYGLKRFPTGAVLQISGSAHNNGVFTVTTGGVAKEIVVAETLTAETAGASVTITDISDPPDDASLESVISAVSRWIDVYTGRRFYVASETRYYTAESSDRLRVDDLILITQLACDVSGARSYDEIWAASDYDLEPHNALLESPPRPYTRIRSSPNGNYAFPTGLAKGVRLAGSFGYSSTPPPQIAEAALIQAARIFKRKDAIFGVMGAAEMGQVLVQPKFDPDVALMLQPFIKMSVGAV